MKRPPYRPSEYADLDVFKEKTEEYLSAGVHHTVKGWAAHLGISRMTLSNYKKRGSAWTAAVEDAMDRIKACRTSG